MILSLIGFTYSMNASQIVRLRTELESIGTVVGNLHHAEQECLESQRNLSESAPTNAGASTRTTGPTQGRKQPWTRGVYLRGEGI